MSFDDVTVDASASPRRRLPDRNFGRKVRLPAFQHVRILLDAGGPVPSPRRPRGVTLRSSGREKILSRCPLRTYQVSLNELRSTSTYSTVHSKGLN